MANLISLARVVLAFYVLIMLGHVRTEVFYYTALFLTLVVIVMDALDGIVARAFNEQSKVGSVLDILGDRIVENAYWIVFACYGWIGLWVPLVVMTRSFVTDTLRSLAFAEGFTAFGSESMIKNPIGSFLTSSRFSRAVYGTAKVVAFIAVIAAHVPSVSIPKWVILTADISVWVTVVMCVIRALAVLVESKQFLTKKDGE